MQCWRRLTIYCWKAQWDVLFTHIYAIPHLMWSSTSSLTWYKIVIQNYNIEIIFCCDLSHGLSESCHGYMLIFSSCALAFSLYIHFLWRIMCEYEKILYNHWNLRRPFSLTSSISLHSLPLQILLLLFFLRLKPPLSLLSKWRKYFSSAFLYFTHTGICTTICASSRVYILFRSLHFCEEINRFHD